MILLHKKCFIVAFAYIFYFFVTLLFVSMLTADSMNWVANISSDMMFICQIAPAFLIGSFFIDETISKTGIIQNGSRSRALVVLLVQQYFFSWLFLLLWILVIVVSDLLWFQSLSEVKCLHIFSLFVRDYLGFLLMIHLSGILKRVGFRWITSAAYPLVLISAIIEILIVPRVNRYFNCNIFLFFSWINYKDFQTSLLVLIILNIILVLALFRINKKMDIF